MILGFREKGTADIYDDLSSAGARRTLPKALWRLAQRKLIILDRAVDLHDLRVPPSNHLEALKGDRAGQHSVRINGQYRICFEWTPRGPTNVEIVDYH